MSDLQQISETAGSTRSVDVIFIHGLGGDPKTTWHPTGKPNDFWPSWLATDLPGIGIWSFGYSAPILSFSRASMGFRDRAINALAHFEASGMGRAPIVFVAHSLGGLLVKQIIRHCVEFPSEFNSRFLNQIKGIIFLATPHSGSQVATWGSRLLSLLAGPSVNELKTNNSTLRELNTWYRNHVTGLHIKQQAYAETKTLHGLLIVDQTSSDPGVADLIPIPVDANHIEIARPASKDSLLYKRVRTFVVHVAEVGAYPETAPAAILGPAPAIAVIVALPEAKLRRILTERLNRNEVAVFWFDTFAESMDDQLPGKPLRECVIELLLRAKRRNALARLYEAIALERPDIGELIASLK